MPDNLADRIEALAAETREWQSKPFGTPIPADVIERIQEGIESGWIGFDREGHMRSVAALRAMEAGDGE